MGIQDLGRKPRSSPSALYYSLKSRPGRHLPVFRPSLPPPSQLLFICVCVPLFQDQIRPHPLSFALALQTASYRLQGFYPFGVPQSHVCRWPRFRFCSVHLNQSLQTAPEQTLWVNSSVQKPRTPSIPRSVHAAQPVRKSWQCQLPSTPPIGLLFLSSSLLPPSSKSSLALTWAGSLLPST